MMTIFRLNPAALAVGGMLALAHAAPAQADADPRTFCRFVPERSDDFAWENDKVAFRAYGPALRKGKENGGFDCWLKRVEYPVIDKWYALNSEGKDYHTDRGEGYDPYHVGASLGCGGIGLWTEGKLVNTETFTAWKVLENEEKKSVFELTYAWEHGGHSYKQVKRISIALGDRHFDVVATTWKDGELAVGLPMAVGLTTHEGKAAATGSPATGWMSCWEEIDGAGLGTGVVMDPSAITAYKEIESEEPDEGHALFLTKTDDKGQVSWSAGYGWARAGEIRNAGEWTEYLEALAAE